MSPCSREATSTRSSANTQSTGYARGSAQVATRTPYGENPNGVSWFYYKKSFTQGDMFKIVRDTLAENSRHVAAIISDIRKFKPKG